MKTLRILLAGVFAVLAIACSDEKDDPVPTSEYGDQYYADNATISSSDSAFTSSDEGGTILFSVTGGEVVIDVDCGTEWTVENHASDVFSAVVESASLTVSAGQNIEERELTSSILLLTVAERIVFATITVSQQAYGAPTVSVETNEWSVPAAGALSTEIAVESSIGEFDVEVFDDWMSAEKTSDSIILTALENDETEVREAVVWVSVSDGIGYNREVINVTQDAKAYISLSNEYVVLSTLGNTTTVSIETNYEMEWSCELADWLSVSLDGNVMTFSAGSNPDSEPREATVLLSSGDGAANIAESRISVTQPGSSSLILVYNISSDNTTVSLPLYGTVNCTVDWGDGSSVQNVTSTGPSHTFSSAGEYTVVIDGTVTSLNSYSTSNKTALSSVVQWGSTGLTSMYRAFYGCTGLLSVPTDSDGAFVNVTSFSNAFNGCTGIKEIPAGLFNYCGNVTTFEYVFDGCTKLATIPEELFANCTECTTFYACFHSCNALTAAPAGLFKNCAKATTFHTAFQNCWSMVTISADMFEGCSGVESFNYLFEYCQVLKEIPAGLFDDCKSVINMQYTFQRCYAITSIPAGLFDNCPEITNMKWLFYNCTSLKEIPSGLFDKNTKNTNFYCLFSYSAISEIPEGLFDNCPEVTDFRYVFRECKSLKSIPAGLFDNCMKVEQFDSAFRDCTALTGESPYTLQSDGSKVHLYERTEALGYTVPTSSSNCFASCTGLSDYSSIPSAWGGGGN